MKILFCFAFIITLSSSLNSQTVLSPGDSLQKKILSGESHIYNVKVKKGGFYKLLIMQEGIDLTIKVKSPGDDTSLYDTPNGANGPERIGFAANQNGNTELIVSPYIDTSNAESGNYVIIYEEELSPLDEEEKIELIDWIKQNSIPLKSVTAGSGFDDLDFLKPVLMNKRVVALGEATHGTKEFFQMKHRMLEYLVRNLGFSVFAIEASYGRCKYINKYILTGEGDLDTAVEILGFTTWETEEVKDMIKWMRDYNIENPDKPVQFVGFDLQINDAVAFAISKYYSKVDPGKKPEVDSLLKKILAEGKKGGIFSGDTTMRTLIAPIAKLMSDFAGSENEFVSKSSKEDYDEVLWDIKILQQMITSFSYNFFEDPGIREGRDFFMAQNVLQWLKYFPEGTKMCIWAHNGHIAKDFLDAVSVPSMGSYLKEALGNDYYAIGFDFYEGKFQSRNIELENSSWEEMSVGHAPEGNLSTCFVKAGLANSILDISGNNQSDIIKQCLNEKIISTYSIGAAFSYNWPLRQYNAPMKLHNAFDCVVFIKESTAAVPVKDIFIDLYKF